MIYDGRLARRLFQSGKVSFLARAQSGFFLRIFYVIFFSFVISEIKRFDA